MQLVSRWRIKILSELWDGGLADEESELRHVRDVFVQLFHGTLSKWTLLATPVQLQIRSRQFVFKNIVGV